MGKTTIKDLEEQLEAVTIQRNQAIKALRFYADSLRLVVYRKLPQGSPELPPGKMARILDNGEIARMALVEIGL